MCSRRTNPSFTAALAFLALGLAVFVGSSFEVLAQTFPVQIKHALGVSTITRQPQRIVTLGWSSEDVVLALGFVPVAMTGYSSFAGGVSPWNAALLGDNRPKLLFGEYDYEEIALLKPDLILSVRSDIDQPTWNRLSQIAPTIGYTARPWEDGWEEQARIIGEALQRGPDIERIIDDNQRLLADISNKFPDIKGRSFVFGTYFAGSPNVVVYLNPDPRVKIISSIGMNSAEVVDRLSEQNPRRTSTSVSLENADKLTSDVLIMWYGPGAREAVEQQDLFRMIPQVQRGNYVALEGPLDVWSTSSPSVLSIPFTISQFASRIADAARATDAVSR